MLYFFTKNQTTIYADKYFSTIKSILALRDMGIHYCGSIRLDRLLSADKKLKNEIEKAGIGNHYYF